MRNYRAAATYASEVLALDGTNAEAAKIRDEAQGMISKFDTALADARRRLSSGDLVGASRALDSARNIDPAAPAVVELASQLNESLRRADARVRDAIEKARAAAPPPRLPPPAPSPPAPEPRRDASPATPAPPPVATPAIPSAAAGASSSRALRRRFRLRHQWSSLRRLPYRCTGAGAPASCATPRTRPVRLDRHRPSKTRRQFNEWLAPMRRAIESKDLALFRSIKPNLSRLKSVDCRRGFAPSRHNAST